MSVKELEKQRSAVRDKMNKRQEKLAIKQPVVKSRKSCDISDFKEGVYVRILSMNIIGTISGKPNQKGEVSVNVGSLSTKAIISDLEILDNYKTPEEKVTAKSSGSGKIRMAKSSSISSEINLLGCTVDEAISRLDKYLDDAYLSKIGAVRIVHGKGTGALRNAVSSYLKGIPYVKAFRLGTLGEGDSGVTIVEFK